MEPTVDLQQGLGVCSDRTAFWSTDECHHETAGNVRTQDERLPGRGRYEAIDTRMTADDSFRLCLLVWALHWSWARYTCGGLQSLISRWGSKRSEGFFSPGVLGASLDVSF